MTTFENRVAVEQPELIFYTDDGEASQEAMQTMDRIGLKYEVRLDRPARTEAGPVVQSPKLWLPATNESFYGLPYILSFLKDTYPED